VRERAERAYFAACAALGRLIRSARYAQVRIVCEDGETRVRKRRAWYAPLLVGMARPLSRVLDTGVRVLPQRDWEARERRMYASLHGASIKVDAGGTLVLPRLAGQTLASLLEDRALEEPVRKTAIERAVLALAELHRLGFTHGDAMAENVLIDLESGAARWFDFETVHDPDRSAEWSRADDLRALASTCLLRTGWEQLEDTLRLILDVYADDGVARLLALHFTSAWRRPLTFHLAQAALSFESFRAIGRLLSERDRSAEPRARFA
jgi:hypothetical protein